MKFKVVPIFAAYFVCWQATVASAATNVVSLTYKPAPVNNPLKGFIPYQGSYHSGIAYSMEWNYIPLRSLMTGLGNFDWSAVDNLLSDVSSRGHQTVFRVYLDFPTLTTGIPQFLLDEGLVVHDYTDYGNTNCSSYSDSDLSSCPGSVSPDYSDPNLQQALTNFIANFGARYDGDPRIGFITVGLLGYWGEWHTYPESQWFASTAVQQQVLSAYQSAFTRTRLQVRYANSTTATYPIGFHDDSFAYDTLPSVGSSFYAGIEDTGITTRWQTQAFGGEVYPPIQSCLFDSSCASDGEQDVTNCVTTVHATWLLNQGAFSPGYTGAQQTAALGIAHLLGYELYVTNATLADATLSGPLNVSVLIENTGVAPFYYNWPVELQVLNSGGTTVQTWTTPWQLASLMPGTNYTLSFTQANHGLAVGQYKLLMGVTNVMANGQSVRFANTSQDADLNGWLTLGTFSVTTNSVAVTNPPPPVLSLASNNVVTLENAGAVTVTDFAIMTTANGFSITNVAILDKSNSMLFAAGPLISTNGTLSFTPATTSNGVAGVTAQAQDNGGTANGRTNESTPQTFTITIMLTNTPSTNVTLVVDPTLDWNAALNFSDTNNNYEGYSNYTLALDPAIFVPTQATATRLLLGVNTNTYAPGSAWDDAEGRPLRNLETDSYVDPGTIYGGDMVTVTGMVESNTIPASSWTVFAVIKEYTAGYASFLQAQTTVLPANGAFSVKRSVAAGDGIQYGFYVYGPNTAPGSAASHQWASIMITNGAVTPPPNAVPITATVSGNTVTLSFPTQTGYTYTVQYCPTLPATTWATLRTTNGTGAIAMPTDAISPVSARYYRVSAQ